MSSKPPKASRILSIFLILSLAGLFAWRWGIPLVRSLTVTPSEDYANQGDQFLAEGRLPEAVLSYRQAVEADPNNAAARESLAQAYAAQGRLRMGANLGLGLTLAQMTGDLPVIWADFDTFSTPTGAALDDQRILTAYEDGTVKINRLEDGAQLLMLRLPAAATSAPFLDDDLAWVGAQDGNVYAIHISSESIIWTFPTGGPVFAAPVLAEGTLFCASSSGSLFALDAQTGALRWKFSTRGALHTSPRVSGNRIVFGSHDARVYALDASSGAPIWKDGILTGGAVENQPAIVDNRVIIGSGDGRVYALALDSGGQFWRISTPDAVYAAVVVDGDTIYIASSGKTLTAVNTLSGEKLWQVEMPGSLRNPPALAGDGLYLTVDGDAGLYRVDKAGRTVTRLGQSGDWNAAGPWIIEQRLFLLGKDGAVLAYTLPD